MKVGRVMRSADLRIHPDDDAEQAAQFKHAKSLRYGGPRRNAERYSGRRSGARTSFATDSGCPRLLPRMPGYGLQRASSTPPKCEPTSTRLSCHPSLRANICNCRSRPQAVFQRFKNRPYRVAGTRQVAAGCPPNKYPPKRALCDGHDLDQAVFCLLRHV
jgi:hypothetical protein